MSTYNDAATIAEKQLKNISKTMCYAKWAQVSMHLTNGTTNSCYHPPLHKIDQELIKTNPKALHNTEQKKQERKQMLAGERPSGCSYCWKIEDSGNRSDRIYRSGEYWAQNARSDIFEAIHIGDVDPRYVEVNFNQACNLKCMYCSPHLSTAWEDSVKSYGDYEVYDINGNLYKHNNLQALTEQGLMPPNLKQSENVYVEAFWKWWPKLYRKLEVFRITGGEPLMDANTYRVLDYIYEHPNTWMELSITTNMSPPRNSLMDKFIDKMKKLEEIQIWEDKERFNPGSGNHWYVNPALKNFALFVSVDSVGEQAEYIRDGLDYSYMQQNVLRFLKETNNTTVTFINTFNILSVTKIREFLDYILSLRKEYSRSNQGVKYIPIYDPYNTHTDYEIHPRQRIWFDLPILRDPKWMSISLLPKEFQSYLEEAIQFMENNAIVDNFDGFYDFEINKLKRNLDLMKSTNNDDTISKRNFYKFFSQYDQKRNKSLIQTFLELEDFYKMCEKLNG